MLRQVRRLGAGTVKSLLAICLCAVAAFPQVRGGRGATAQTSAAPVPAPSATGAAFVRENYTKFEYRIPMRDGVKLFTSVYIPKDVFTDGRTYPIMMQRTGYNVAPYGADQYRANLGPSELFAREKFIFVYQDVRGRFMSEGEYVLIRPHNPNKGPQGHRREHRHLRHHRLAGEECSRQHRQGRHVGHLAARLLCDRRHDRRASRAGRGVAAGSRDRLLHGRRRLSQRRVHAGPPLQFLHGLPAARRRSRAAAARAHAFRFRHARRLRFLSQHGVAGQRRREVFQAQAAAVAC